MLLNFNEINQCKYGLVFSQKILTKLDKRYGKVYEALPEKTLVVTVMVENTRGFSQTETDKNSVDGRVFAGIKMSPMSVDDDNNPINGVSVKQETIKTSPIVDDPINQKLLKLSR